MKKLNWLTVLSIFIILKLILHLVVNGKWGFHRDELLYLALGRHLDWGFASVPPSIGIWAWFGTDVLGGSVDAIRIISTVFATATVILTALMAREMVIPDQEGKKSSGLFAVTLVGLSGLLCGAFLRPAMLFMPVVFDLFYWTMLSWLFLKYIQTQKTSWLLWFGVVSGLALLNKYSVLIFLFALLPGILISSQRKIFSKKALYIAAGLCLLIFLPNILWQAAHEFPVFRHMSELAATQFVHVSLDSFFLDQLRFYLPAFPVWIIGLFFLSRHPAARPWSVFAIMYVTVLAVLLIFRAKSYYALGAYPVLLAAGAAYLENYTAQRRQWIRIALPILMIALGLLAMPAALPLFKPEKEARFVQGFSQVPGLKGILRWEDGRYYTLPQDFADMLGWQEIADATGQLWQSIPNKNTAAIYAENYGLAGAIEHLGKKYGMPPVVSFSDTYRYWLPDRVPENLQTFIYVNDELGDDMPGYFTSIKKAWELNMPLSRQHGVQIYFCENPTPLFFERVNSLLEQIRNEEPVD